MPLFTKDALALISLCSEGIPRNINNLCFNALSLGSALQQKPIDRDVVRQVIADLDLGPLRKKGHPQLLPPVEEISSPRVPAMFAAANPSPSVFAGWVPRVAIAAVVLLAVAGSLFESRHWLARSATPQSASAASVQPATTGSTPGVASDPAPVSSDPPGASASEPPLPAVKSEPPVAVNPVAPDSSVAAAADPAAGVQTNHPLPPAISPTATLFNAERNAQTDSAGIIEVSPGQTLLGICAEKFGTCTAELLQQIHELNPHMSDPDHIETGQKLRLPVLAAQSNGGEPRKAPERGTHE